MCLLSVSLRCIEVLESEQVLISLDALDFSFAEQLLCALGERAGQRGITSLVEQEVAILFGDRLLAVDGDCVLAQYSHFVLLYLPDGRHRIYGPGSFYYG